VADALSRIPKTNEINSLTITQHSAQSSGHNLIYNVEAPINAFKNQIFIHKENPPNYKFTIPFPTFHRHIITQPNLPKNTPIELLKKISKSFSHKWNIYNGRNNGRNTKNLSGTF